MSEQQADQWRERLREQVADLHARARAKAENYVRSSRAWPQYKASEVTYETVLKLIDAASNEAEAALASGTPTTDWCVCEKPLICGCGKDEPHCEECAKPLSGLTVSAMIERAASGTPKAENRMGPSCLYAPGAREVVIHSRPGGTMANKVWTFFKKLGHWISVGANDIEKFEQAAQASGVLPLLPGGAVINAGFGVFEKIFTGIKDVQVMFSAAGQASDGPAKLLAATPKGVEALLDFAESIGMKITDPAKLQTIASGYSSLTADFWNILEPKTGDKLPTPATPAAPATTSAPAPPPKS